LHYLKLDNVAFLKGFEALALYGRVMYEDVRSAILANEAVAFTIVEPLHFPLKSCHFHASLIALGISATENPHKKAKAEGPTRPPAALQVRFPDGYTVQTPALMIIGQGDFVKWLFAQAA
jgi:hypothetical protein